MPSEKNKEIIGAIGIVLLFVVSSWLVQTRMEAIAGFIGGDFRGMAIYVLVGIATIVLAPVTTLPLVPIAAGLWGGLVTALLNILAWTAGAMLAFGLARLAGIRFVRRVVPLERLERLEKRIPEGGKFWTIVFLRMLIPVDILSYALGLFSRVRPGLYFWATLIGIIPFAFILSFAGRVPFAWQIAGIAVIAAVGLIWWGIRQSVARLEKRE